MAVSLTIHSVEINNALNAEFKDGFSTYKIVLLDSSDEPIVVGKEVTFDSASGGVIDLVSSVFFAIPSGNTVAKMRLDKGILEILTYDLTDETFNSNGTYTINNVIITFDTV